MGYSTGVKLIYDRCPKCGEMFGYEEQDRARKCDHCKFDMAKYRDGILAKYYARNHITPYDSTSTTTRRKVSDLLARKKALEKEYHAEPEPAEGKGYSQVELFLPAGIVGAIVGLIAATMYFSGVTRTIMYFVLIPGAGFVGVLLGCALGEIVNRYNYSVMDENRSKTEAEREKQKNEIWKKIEECNRGLVRTGFYLDTAKLHTIEYEELRKRGVSVDITDFENDWE